MASNPVYNPYNQQPPPGSGQPMPAPPDGNSYASRSAQAYVNSTSNNVPPPVDQYQQSLLPQPPQVPPPASQSFQQPPYYTPTPPVTQQTPAEPNYNPQYGRIPSPYHNPNPQRPDTKTVQSQQNLLETSIRRMQEATHIMRGAMDADDLTTTLDRAAAMLGELGDPKHHHSHHHHGHGHHSHGHSSSSSSSTAVMSPKHYYEIHMLAMEELPNIEEYLLSLSSGPTPRYSMKDLYEITQYTSRAVPRLYLQICAGSALIRSGEQDVTNVLNDLIQAVKCVQCPIRGLFLRDYLLKAVRDKLPDEAEVIQPPVAQQTFENEQSNDNLSSLMGDLTMNTNEVGRFLENGENTQTQNINPNNGGRARSDSFENTSGKVKDSYQFVLANFIEMNKLWVRIQHLPGDAKNKETKRRRERERNELRMMVGTNLVRLSELEGVTSSIYGTVILPRILDQIVACRDPLAQAYLMDCIIQVFPDEFHIQTLEVVLGVCPKLREKVNIRTILQSIMDRLSNYYADELLLNDEEDTEGVKTSVMLDSFEIFDECIRAVLEGRGAKINAKEVVRLESSLLDFSLKCYPGRMDHINRCLGVCAACLRGQGASSGALTTESGMPTPIPIDEVAIKELETLLSLPLETMGLNILDLDQYSELLQFLPLDHRKRVALELLNVLYQSGEKMTELSEIEQLFAIVSPLIWNDGNTLSFPNASVEKESISKLIHLLHNDDTDIQFEILNFVKKYLFSSGGGIQACSYTVSPLFYSSMKLLRRVKNLEFQAPDEESKEQIVEEGEEIAEKDETDDNEIVSGGMVDGDEAKEVGDEAQEVKDEPADNLNEEKEEEVRDEVNKVKDEPVDNLDEEKEEEEIGDELVDENKDDVHKIEEGLEEVAENAVEDSEQLNEIGKDVADVVEENGVGNDNGAANEDKMKDDGDNLKEEETNYVDDSKHEVDSEHKSNIEETEGIVACKDDNDSSNTSELEESQPTAETGDSKVDQNEQEVTDDVEEVKSDGNAASTSSKSDEEPKAAEQPQITTLFPFDDTTTIQTTFTKATK